MSGDIKHLYITTPEGLPPVTPLHYDIIIKRRHVWSNPSGVVIKFQKKLRARSRYRS